MIILAFGVPDIDGPEVARRIREFSAAHILMLTAETHNVEEHYRGAGVDDLSAAPPEGVGLRL